MNRYPLRLKPVSKNALWGGKKLIEKYGKHNDRQTLAESWELTLHAEGMSVIENGEYAGMTLAEYLSVEKDADGSYHFPLMIKFIDAEDKLSVQVHPDKTELWYIVEASEGAQLVYGLKSDFNEVSFRAALQEGKLEDLLRFVDVHEGEFYLLPSGLVHAIGGGLLIAEIQQNSNITYRVYDYNRGRETHTEKAIETIKLLNENGNYAEVTECDFFKVEKRIINGEAIINTDNTFVHVLFVNGSGYIGNEPAVKGSSYFIPQGSGDTYIKSREEIIILITIPNCN
jgi:mannose-6-phosphate isomerase